MVAEGGANFAASVVSGAGAVLAKGVAITAGVGETTLATFGVATTSTAAPIVVGVVVIGGSTYVVYKAGSWCLKKLF